MTKDALKHSTLIKGSTAIVAVLFFAALLTGCQCSKDEGKADGTKTSITPVPAGGVPTESYAELRSDIVRLTPEQISEHVYRVFGVKLGYEDERGVFHDHIIEQLGPALGGVDFQISFRRDPDPRVTTLLIVRMLAGAITNEVMRNAENPAAEPRIFGIANIREDRPFHPDDANLPEDRQAAILEGERRWNAQIEDLYWRMFSRPPTVDEVVLLRELFLKAYEEQTKFPPAAWTAVVLALVSTVEFWTI